MHKDDRNANHSCSCSFLTSPAAALLCCKARSPTTTQPYKHFSFHPHFTDKDFRFRCALA